MSSNKMIDFESPEFDGADVLREDARIDAAEAAADSQRHLAAARAFETAVLQHAVNTCLSSCLDCLDLLYIPREQQPISDIAVAHDSWKQEPEPEPCSKDSWLRGAIPEAPPLLQHNSSSCSSGQAALLANSSTVNSPKGGLSSRPMSGLGAAARRSSLASSSAAAEAAAGTSDALTSTMRRTSVSRSSGRPTRAIGRSPSVRSSQSVKDGAAAGAGSSSVRRPSIRPAAQQQHAAGKQPSHHNDAEDRLRQELQVRRQQEAIAREMKQKAEQARAALIAVQKELKGKDYTYDSSGKLVLLQKVDPERLPAPPGPQFKVRTPAAAAEAEAAGKQGGTSKSLSSSSKSLAGTNGKGSSSSGGGGGKPRGSKSPAIPSSDFKQTTSQTQPPVLETLRPAAGVTLRAGAAAKPGPKRDLAGHPTRAQYQQQAKAQNQQATRVVASAAAGGSSAGGRGVAGNASMRGSSAGFVSAAGAAAGTTSGTSSSAPGLGAAGPAAAAASGTAASSSGRASPALAAAGDSRGGVSSAGAASPLSSSAGMLSSTGQGSGSNAGQLRTAAAGVQRRPASPDVNLVLVSAADWGAVGSSGYSPPAEGPLAVHKPSDKQIKEEFGRTTFLPKIRSPVQTLKPPKSQPASTGSLRAGAAAPAAR